jgi:hypothetical protein
MIRLGRLDCGNGDSMVVKFTTIAFLVFAGSCSGRREQSNEHSGRPDDRLYADIKSFWSSSLASGGTSRSIGLDELHGLYFYWERREMMPMTLLHTSFGRYEEESESINLSNPFGSEFSFRIEMHDGVKCMIPRGMTLVDGQKSGWLLIHREGASSASPFAIKKRTAFDNPR